MNRKVKCGFFCLFACWLVGFVGFFEELQSLEYLVLKKRFVCLLFLYSHCTLAIT